MILAAPPPPPAAVTGQAPSALQAALVEQRYVPPAGGGRQAGALDGYVRSYWRDAADPDVVRGQYVRPGRGIEGPPRVRLVASAREAGFVFDGGCGVVNVTYRLSTAALEARCGGR